jgi:hypothetical protein
MRLPHLASLAGVLSWLVLAACEGPAAPTAPDPSQIALQTGDLPPDVRRCPASGDLDGYLRELRNPLAHDELAAAWSDLRRQGATSAALAVYSAQPAACEARLGAGDGTNVSSLVVHFRSDDAAAAAYQRGLLGFSTPGEDEEVQGLTRGAATGLGRNAWLVERQVSGRSMLVAYWQRHAVAVFLIGVDEDPLHARQALTAIDGRIG